MSLCGVRKLMIGACSRVPFHPGIGIWHPRSVPPKCTCILARHQWNIVVLDEQQRRHLSVTRVHRQEKKIVKSFDEYYSAVIEAHRDSESLRQYKYRELPEDATDRDIQLRRSMFTEAVDIYVEKTDSPHFTGIRRGHIEFTSQALERMRELGVHRELACYKALMKVLPPDIMIPVTALQREFHHYQKQQDSALEILEQMEDNAVVPDQESRDLLTARFGKHTHVIRKVRRMIYWMRKFRNANPYQLPHYIPIDPIKRAILALKKMSVDLENEIKVFKVKEQEHELFIASAQSRVQRDMIRKHPESVPLYVEGGSPVWLRDECLTYFVLRSDTDPSLFQYPTLEEEKENLFEFETIFDAEEPKELAPKPNDHQQEDGTILGMCITETGTKDSLISWIRCLQEANPSLEKIPIVFALQTPDDGLVPAEVPVDDETQIETIRPSKS